jgi:hypothetical protein
MQMLHFAMQYGIRDPAMGLVIAVLTNLDVNPLQVHALWAEYHFHTESNTCPQ